MGLNPLSHSILSQVGIKSSMLRSLNLTYKLTPLQYTKSRIQCTEVIWDYNLGEFFLRTFLSSQLKIRYSRGNKTQIEHRLKFIMSQGLFIIIPGGARLSTAV